MALWLLSWLFGWFCGLVPKPPQSHGIGLPGGLKGGLDLGVALDVKYGTHLYNSAEESTKSELEDIGSQEFDGQLSCLQICKTMARETDPVNGETTAVLLTQFLTQPACKLPRDLHPRFEELEPELGKLERHADSDAAGSRMLLRSFIAHSECRLNTMRSLVVRWLLPRCNTISTKTQH